MNINRIFICTFIVSGSLQAMEMPVGEAPLQQCSGSLLANQPDLCHPVTVNSNNYFLAKRKGKELTEHDKELSRQILPFAAARVEYPDMGMKNIVGGFIAQGLFCAAIYFSLRLSLRSEQVEDKNYVAYYADFCSNFVSILLSLLQIARARSFGSC